MFRCNRPTTHTVTWDAGDRINPMAVYHGHCTRLRLAHRNHIDTRQVDPGTRGMHFTIAVLVVVAAMLGYLAVSNIRAYAADSYGPGWTVRPHLIVGPLAVVHRSTLPPCANEDGSGGPRPCSWNFAGETTGNGIGLSYWIGRTGRIHYVWPTQPQHGWHHVPSALADAIAESDVAGATTRHWRRCITLNVVVRCADGATVLLDGAR